MTNQKKIKITGYKNIEDVSLSDMAWKDNARCSDKETSMFFSSPKSDSTSIAISICKQCSVRSNCFYESLIYGYDGVWGGSTLDQRKAIITAYLDSNLSNLSKDQINDFIRIVDTICRTKNTALTDIYNSNINNME